jgi:hypothetical protein
MHPLAVIPALRNPMIGISAVRTPVEKWVDTKEKEKRGINKKHQLIII